ncbi:C-Jun-amino-terminal kinase-interacting protein 4-like isoform X5 [Eriocheir sinensis]|uniref:C-Jun-amino-terminal kinase-interacting protein 4-like isoform X5 n=1 Tax=Eriocheir sinensis TaxID=95602 RepID=UPI0021C71E87|nr:C-Jun-amino-terminal kinase-interacting protein 4-like isoform X5 [Eriocheir sinensis]
MDVLDGETVYNSHDESHVVMSEKVQSMAGSIYQEFERMISRYDEDVVKDLMPLVVNILECLDLAYTENQEHEVEVELLREDNEQLVTQYEREKQLRKASEQKLLELEDGMEEEKKKCQSRVETLESIVRMLELKNRNSSDHATRMEDKSEEIKKEYGKLHDRYTELFKTHMDYMERTKILMGTDRLDQLGGARGRIPGFSLGNLNSLPYRSSGPVSFGFSSFDPNKSMTSPVDMTGSANGSVQVTSLRNELQEAQVGPDTPVVHTDKGQLTDTIEQADRETATKGGWVDGFSPESEVVSSPEMEDLEDISMDTSLGPHHIPPGKMARPTTTQQKEERTGNTLYQEIHFQEPDALAEMDEGADITDSGSEEGGPASPPYAVTDNFFGMGKEVENLIMENNELLATKNALNIVKDDLIAKVDELTSEQEILREEIKSLNAVKSRLRLRIAELEDEVKRVKEEAEKAAKAGKSDDEEDVPMAQRKRFTRVEMARVLMERNQYKERFMELQEAVRWTEMIRATRTDPATDKKNKQTIWKFFSNLFSTSEKPQRKPLPYGNVRYNAPAHQVTPALDTMRRRNLSDHRRKGLEIFDAGLEEEESETHTETHTHTPSHTPPADTSPTSSSPPPPSSSSSFLFLNLLPHPHSSSEKLQQRRATERREQYKQVRAHVKKDDGRMQAYGWSLPAKTGQRAIEGGPAAAPAAATAASQPPRASAAASSHIPVPVPVYCRPLMEKEPGMKIWCAAGVNLTGGRTRDGGNIVGASVFYSGETETTHVRPSDEIDRLDQELKEGERERREGELLEQSLSSLVWICTSTHSISKVTVIDANNPADILESFHVCSSHLLCIASVPGAKESDYEVDDDINKASEESLNNNSSTTNTTTTTTTKAEEEEEAPGGGGGGGEGKAEENPSMGTLSFISCAAGSGITTQSPTAPDSPDKETEEIKPVLRRETISCTDPDQDADHAGVMGGEEEEDTPPRRLLREPQGLVKDGVEEAQPTEESSNVVTEEVEKMSSVLSTMWLGSQSGSIYVHSAVRHWKRCLHSIKLKDSVLSIVHIKGRVLAALADGTVAIFQRRGDGQWDLNNYHLLDLGKPHHSIRCMQVVHGRVWCGYRNKIHVVDPKHMTIEKSFDAHPRKESQVRQMAWLGDGVWVSIRLDSTLRLYHAHTHQHLQDVDIEPYVSKMLGTGKLGFSFVRITALLISSHRLWIGTGNGVIISVPLSESANPRPNQPNDPNTTASTAPATAAPAPPAQPQGGSKPGGVIRVYTDSRDQLTPGSFAPYCSMAQAQLSFHGHRDAVKFFVAVPAAPAASALRAIAGRDGEDGASEGRQDGQLRPKSMLVISGGEGYIDFRIADEREEDRDTASHLLVWHIPLEDNLSSLHSSSSSLPPDPPPPPPPTPPPPPNSTPTTAEEEA